jgi:methionyl-tRNA formyltransferase
VRVVILTQNLLVANGFTQGARALGHDVPALIVARPASEPEALLEAAGPADVLFPASKRSLAPLLASYDADVALCGGFPWLVPQEAIDTPRLGIVNCHPTMLPKGRGPYPWAWAARTGETELGLTFHFMDASFDTGNVLAQKPIPFEGDDTEETLIPKVEAAAFELMPEVFAKLEAGDAGTPQEDAEYQRPFEPEYAHLDLTRTAEELHRQVRAWSFMPERARIGPILDGRRLVRTSLVEVEGAERLDCADGALWIVETATA